MIKKKSRNQGSDSAKTFSKHLLLNIVYISITIVQELKEGPMKIFPLSRKRQVSIVKCLRTKYPLLRLRKIGIQLRILLLPVLNFFLFIYHLHYGVLCRLARSK